MVFHCRVIRIEAQTYKLMSVADLASFEFMLKIQRLNHRGSKVSTKLTKHNGILHLKLKSDNLIREVATQGAIELREAACGHSLNSSLSHHCTLTTLFNRAFGQVATHGTLVTYH